jgi:transketolase
MRNGKKLTVLPIGNLMGKAIKFSDALKDVEVLYIPQLKPFDIDLLKKHLQITKRLLILEDGFIQSGIGEHIITQLNFQNIDYRYKIIGASDKFPIQGSLDEVYEDYGLSDKNILNEARQLISE